MKHRNKKSDIDQLKLNLAHHLEHYVGKNDPFGFLFDDIVDRTERSEARAEAKKGTYGRKRYRNNPHRKS